MVRPSHSSSSPWPARFWNRQKVPGPLILLAKLDPSFRRLLLRWEAAVEPELVCRPLAELIGGLARSHAPRDGQAAGPQGAGADPQQLDAAIAEALPAPLRHVPRPQRAVLVVRLDSLACRVLGGVLRPLDISLPRPYQSELLDHPPPLLLICFPRLRAEVPEPPAARMDAPLPDKRLDEGNGQEHQP